MNSMIKKFSLLLVSLGLLGAFALVPAVGAVNVTKDGDEETSTLKNEGNDDFSTLMTRIISTLLFIVGIIAVIMIIVGGIKYTTANGDPGALKSAKNTILYSVLGLILAIMAFAIVNFVLSVFSDGQ